MRYPIATRQPFSFDQTLTFIRRFPPCRNDVLLEADAVTAAITIDGEAVTFTLRGGDAVTCEAPSKRVAARASDWIGAQDDVAALYAAAEGDDAFSTLVRQLHGLHHVRFLTLEEITIYCVMMQRAPIARASQMKRDFLAAFGLPIEVRGRTLRAMPDLAQLGELDGAAIGAAIRHAAKGATIAGVVRGVAALGEAFLRTAPYAVARDALLAIHGVGPFSAAAILLRGLGRMDELPAMRGFDDDARVIYGAAYDETAVLRRYGTLIGYWSFYVKTGAARIEEARA